MDKGLSNFGLGEYDLDNLGSTLLGVYEEQQNIVKPMVEALKKQKNYIVFYSHC